MFGGLADGPALERLARLIGEQPVATMTRTSYMWIDYVTHGREWRPRLSPAQIRELPPEWVLLLYHEAQPFALWVPLHVRMPVWRPVLLPWPVPATDPERVWQPAESDR